MRQQFICGNWKMHGTSAETTALIQALRAKLDEVTGVEVGIAPSFPMLAVARQSLAGSRIQLTGQNCHWEANGAFTGEVSASQLRDVGCGWVIVGHSERRQYFGETDITVNKRARAALTQGLLAIVCVGETLAEREAGQTLAVVERQMRVGLQGFSPAELLRLVIAYEPVWAIGTGKVATPAQAQEVHAAIRAWLVALGGRETADALRILYGGSVKGDNAVELLVGGASLKADDFARIVHSARRLPA
jgi:triosephosphate isomerase